MDNTRLILDGLIGLAIVAGYWRTARAARRTVEALAKADALEDSVRSWHQAGIVSLAALKLRLQALEDQVDTVTDAMGPSVGWEENEGEEWKAT